MSDDLGHWISLVGPFDPTNHYGFVYKITDSNGYFYYGQKKFHSKIRRKPLKGKKRVRLDTKPSDWKTYNSSGYFKDLIDVSGSEGYNFEIMQLCGNANDLNVTEIEYIVLHGRNILCRNEFICRGASYKNLKGKVKNVR